MNEKNDMTLVTVCDSCLSVECWEGKFYCDDYKTAGTCQIPKFRAEKYKTQRMEE